MISFNYLMAQALLILNAKLKKENTTERVGGLFRDLLNFIQNVILGIILKGELPDETTIKKISNPVKGDTYKASSTGNYWCYDGGKWNDIGKIIPSELGIQSLEKEDSLYVYRIDDKDKRILLGILKDGTVTPTKFKLPLSVWNEINSTIKNATSIITEQDSESNLFEIRDKDGRIVFAITKDGCFYSPKNITYQEFASENFIYVIEDRDGRALFSITNDGTAAPVKLRLPDNAIEQINHMIDEKLIQFKSRL